MTAPAFRNPVRPGQTVSSYVLTNLSEDAKLVQLDLVSSERALTFSFQPADWKCAK